MASVLSADHYHDEQAAYAWIEARVWPDGPICPHCGSVDNATVLSRYSPDAVRRDSIGLGSQPWLCDSVHPRSFFGCSSLRWARLAGWEDRRRPPGGRIWAARGPLVDLRRIALPLSSPTAPSCPVRSPARAALAAGRCATRL